MVPFDSTVQNVGNAVADRPALHPESAQWLRTLTCTGSEHDLALTRLHGLLLRIARSEVHRRDGQLQIAGPELDDLAYQATADALLAITGKIGKFRGESRFTTRAMEALHLYIEVVATGGGADAAEERYPGIAAHLRACGPCGEDFDGLLAAVSSPPTEVAGPAPEQEEIR